MASFQNLCHLPDNEIKIILILRNISEWMTIQNCIVPLHEIKLIANQNKIKVDFVQNKFNEFHCLEHPRGIDVQFPRMKTRTNSRIWFEWLKELLTFLKPQYMEKDFFQVLVKFYNEQLQICEKSKESIKKLNHMNPLKNSVLFEWIENEFYFTFPLNYENFVNTFIFQMNTLLAQIGKKEEHQCVMKNLLKIFNLYKMQVISILQSKDDKKFNEIALEFKREMNKFLDSKYSFINTSKVNFRHLLKSMIQMDLYLEPVDFSFQKSLCTFHLILNLGFEKYQQNYENAVFDIHGCSQSLAPEFFTSVHPFLRGNMINSVI